MGRTKGLKSALLRHLALSLIKYGKIKTTEAKAKELRPFVEKLVSKGKVGTMHSKRLVTARLFNRRTESEKFFKDIVSRYQDRKGGYTRIIKAPRRISDGSKMAVIEFIEK